jgi:hypothetical protein
LGVTKGENAAHTCIFLAFEQVDVSLGRAAVRKPGAHGPKLPNASKFRAILLRGTRFAGFASPDKAGPPLTCEARIRRCG